jgi:molybdopterin synthase sulfur carrier subunit
MNVNILAFGIVKDIFQRPCIEIELKGKATVETLKSSLEEKFPRLKQLASYMIAVNDEYAAVNDLINANDEIAIIPPVSGG